MPYFRLTPGYKRIANKIIPFGLIWSFLGLVYIFVERGILGNSKFYPSTSNPYDFESSLYTTIVGSFFLGILFGLMEVVYLNRLFVHVSFGKKLFFKTSIYGLVIFVFIIINTLVGNSFTFNASVFDPAVINSLLLFINNFAFWSVLLYIVSFIGMSIFMLEVSDYLGQGVLNNFLTGKYHNPREEERVFMFLDMKSSTTIAEKLGHIKYYQLLNEYYADITKAILKTSGEIYQYVGDEIIVSWKLDKGIQQNNCLSCFFMIKKIFNEVSGKYMKEYGLVPGFKAGVHYGHVTTGEIGVIKKEIVFTGDVLNTTSRIQGLCNTYETDILISNDLVSELNIGDTYEVKEIGEIELRGKNEKVKLSTVSIKGIDI